MECFREDILTLLEKFYHNINDLSCINRAGLGVAVAAALAPVLEAADLVLRAKGGHAAAREVIDLLLSQRENS